MSARWGRWITPGRSGRLRGRGILALGVALVLGLCGCASPSIERRRADRAETYAALSPEARAQVDREEIAAGMDTNTVFIAWGRPTRVVTSARPEGPELEWSYYRPHFESTPVYFWRQDGRGGLTLDSYDDTTASRRLTRRVIFRDGRVAWFQTYRPVLP